MHIMRNANRETERERESSFKTRRFLYLIISTHAERSTRAMDFFLHLRQRFFTARINPGGDKRMLTFDCVISSRHVAGVKFSADANSDEVLTQWPTDECHSLTQKVTSRASKLRRISAPAVTGVPASFVSWLSSRTRINVSCTLADCCK